MKLFRIGDERYSIWDGTGAALIGGRWNSPGKPVIYSSLNYSCAMLEALAHANIGRLPSTHSLIIAEVPNEISIERYDETMLPVGWDSDVYTSARALGDQWLQETRSALLIVPSVVARLDWIAVVNPLHPEASKISISTPEKIIWDKRLFK